MDILQAANVATEGDYLNCYAQTLRRHTGCNGFNVYKISEQNSAPVISASNFNSIQFNSLFALFILQIK